MSGMEFANVIFNYDLTRSDSLKDQIQEKIKENDMTALYEALSSKYGWELDQDLLTTMK